MMARINILLIVGGLALGYFGFLEFRLGYSASAEPESVELKDIEAGNIPENTHLKIGTHVAMYPLSVYTYEADDDAGGIPDNSSKVRYSYHAIISEEHNFMKQLAEYQAAENPEEVEVPELDTVAVLVRSEKFKTIGSIPDTLETEDSVQGLVINQIASLDNEEKDLIRQSFANVDFDQILVLSQDRKPNSVAISILMILGGVALAVLGGALFFIV